MGSAAWRPLSSSRTSRRGPATLATLCRGTTTTRRRCALGSSTTAASPCSPPSARLPPACTRARMLWSSSGSEPSHASSADGAVLIFVLVGGGPWPVYPLRVQCLGADFRGLPSVAPTCRNRLDQLAPGVLGRHACQTGVLPAVVFDRSLPQIWAIILPGMVTGTMINADHERQK